MPLTLLAIAGNHVVALFMLGLAPLWRSRLAYWKGWVMACDGGFVLDRLA